MSPITPSRKNNESIDVTIADDTSLSNLNESSFLDFKIGLGGVAIVKEEALRIPLYG